MLHKRLWNITINVVTVVYLKRTYCSKVKFVFWSNHFVISIFIFLSSSAATVKLPMPVLSTLFLRRFFRLSWGRLRGTSSDLSNHTQRGPANIDDHVHVCALRNKLYWPPERLSRTTVLQTLHHSQASAFPIKKCFIPRWKPACITT